MSDFNNDIKCFVCKLNVTGRWLYNPEFIAGKNPPYYHMKCWLDTKSEINQSNKENGDGVKQIQQAKN